MMGGVILWFSCAHDFSSDFEGEVDEALVDSGSSWLSEESCKKKEDLVKKEYFWCKYFPSLCKKNEASTSGSSCVATESVLHSTHYCKLDERGNPASQDYIHINGGDTLSGITGGCVLRPIKEVWAVLLNFGVMKPEAIHHFQPVERKDLENFARRIFYVVDVRNTVGSFIGDVKWDVRYYYTVSHGSYSSPKQIVINFQKIWGSSFIEYIRGGYILDYVSPQVTSFVMTQAIKATQYDAGHLRKDLSGDFAKARTQAPNWKNLPTESPAAELDFSNIPN